MADLNLNPVPIRSFGEILSTHTYALPLVTNGIQSAMQMASGVVADCGSCGGGGVNPWLIAAGLAVAFGVALKAKGR